MSRFLAARLVSALPTVIGVSMIAFAVTALPPGDPAFLILQRQTGEVPSDEAVASLRTRMHLDDPLPVRYVRWVTQAARGDLGESYRTGEPVSTLLAARASKSAGLAAAALALGLGLGVPLGVAAAARAGSIIDWAIRTAVVIGDSWPAYVVAYVLLVVFAVGLGWLPVAGADTWRHAVLPVATLALGLTAGIVRITRAAVLDALDREYTRMARARGLGRTAVLWRHAAPAAALLLSTVMSVRLAHLLSGAVIVETVFAWPGLGQALVAAVFERDHPVVQALVLYAGVTLVAIDVVADAALGLADPRIRLEA